MLKVRCFIASAARELCHVGARYRHNRQFGKYKIATPFKKRVGRCVKCTMHFAIFCYTFEIIKKCFACCGINHRKFMGWFYNNSSCISPIMVELESCYEVKLRRLLITYDMGLKNTKIIFGIQRSI